MSPDPTVSRPHSSPVPLDPEPPSADLEDDELIMHLERDQLAAETFRPVARAKIGRRAAIALWALRIGVLVVSAMVIYTFIARL